LTESQVFCVACATTRLRSAESDNYCDACLADLLGSAASRVPDEMPAVHVKHHIKITRQDVGNKLLDQAETWARRNGSELKRRDKKMVAETRKKVEALKQSGKQGEIRMAARLPGRWFAEKRLVHGDAFAQNPERIEHEARKDNLWLQKD
jgi:hypothetical protein